MEEKILTLHPDGKKGVNIHKHKYDIIADFILIQLKKKKEISYQELNKLAVSKLSKKIDGSVTWYLVTVKLDMEARGIIARIPNSSPHILKLV